MIANRHFLNWSIRCAIYSCVCHVACFECHTHIPFHLASQDAVATIKRRLQLLLPGIKVFLDVDNLNNMSELEKAVTQSAVVLIKLGSRRYFSSIK